MIKHYTAVLWTMLLVFPFLNAVWAQPAQTPKLRQSPVETPQRILFVGNSYVYYNDSLHNHVRRIAVASDPAIENSLQYKSATIGGAPLAHHNIQHLLKTGQLGMKEPRSTSWSCRSKARVPCPIPDVRHFEKRWPSSTPRL